MVIDALDVSHTNPRCNEFSLADNPIANAAPLSREYPASCKSLCLCQALLECVVRLQENSFQNAVTTREAEALAVA
jgi:hypothetical protein